LESCRISFDCIAGPSDLIIDGYNGFLITELDQKTYKEKLMKLMDDNVFVKLAKNTQKHANEFNIF
jgi:GalNAc-alpha-(1->4)-GalNAc-alpha-(1->3)-diNAcBac-PP-undecaprenol alpha-1,4-N-acetyl-D-galactosaminyltransferase